MYVMMLNNEFRRVSFFLKIFRYLQSTQYENIHINFVG